MHTLSLNICTVVDRESSPSCKTQSTVCTLCYYHQHNRHTRCSLSALSAHIFWCTDFTSSSCVAVCKSCYSHFKENCPTHACMAVICCCRLGSKKWQCAQWWSVNVLHCYALHFNLHLNLSKKTTKNVKLRWRVSVKGTYIILHSAPQTFSWRNKNKMIFINGGTLNPAGWWMQQAAVNQTVCPQPPKWLTAVLKQQQQIWVLNTDHIKSHKSHHQIWKKKQEKM